MKQKLALASLTRTTFLLSLIIAASCAAALAQNSAFSFQGRLSDGTATANGNYDLRFSLKNTATGGDPSSTPTPPPPPVTLANVAVTNGVFTVQLDFGGDTFNGEPRWLEIEVKRPQDGGYSTLSPRQKVDSTPYATFATTALHALTLNGRDANLYVATDDARLSNSRAPTVGSGNYIQNQNSAAQATANFRIAGTGAADTFNASTQFDIGGSRVFSIGGTGNTFAGVSSGAANPTGNNNSFFGREAGFSTTTGVSNSFFGNTAGRANLGGNNNSFFGRDAGRSNETGLENSFFGVNAGYFSTGGQNVFLGVQAGFGNTTGSSNTLVGTSANVGSGALSFATALGSGAVVAASDTVVIGRGADAVQIPGSLTVTGTLTANINGASITNLNASNIATGTLSSARLGTVPIANGGTGSATQNFVDLTTAQTVGGNKTFSATVSANVLNASQYNTEGLRAFGVNGLNTYGGIFAGETGTGNHNTFFGRETGRMNIASFNTFIGSSAGRSSVGAANNTFVGFAAGSDNLSGTGNSIFGSVAGQFSSSGINNSIFGYIAGNKNNSGSHNSFFGNNAAANNTSGSNNSFFGVSSGKANTLGGLNTFVGDAAGLANTTGSNNTIIGAGADVGSSGLFYATAVGAGTVALLSNSINLGRQEDRVIVPSGRIRLSLVNGGGISPLCFNTSNAEIAACSSSLRYKTNIAPFTSGLDLVKRLQPITFDWKGGGMHDLGLGAEDVAAVEPLLATYNKDGQIEGVKYDRVGVVLLNAVKEQQAQIERQQRQINDLKQIVCSLKTDAAVCQ